MADPADDLYALDPSEFTAARNALVKDLKKAGEKERAAAVAALRKPSSGAWALNQVARSRPDLIEAALTAGADLRAATDRAMGGDAGALRDATAADRAATEAVVDAAAALLGPRGAAARQGLAGTVRAAVLDEGVADRLRRGVLATEHDASGFGFGDVAEVVPLRRRSASSGSKGTGEAKAEAGGSGEDREERRRRQEEAERAEEAAREQRRLRAEAEERLRRLERRAARLAEVAERAEEAAREAREDADEATAAVEEARAALEALD